MNAQQPVISDDGRFYWDGSRWQPMSSSTRRESMVRTYGGAFKFGSGLGAFRRDAKRLARDGWFVTSQETQRALFANLGGSRKRIVVTYSRDVPA